MRRNPLVPWLSLLKSNRLGSSDIVAVSLQVLCGLVWMLRSRYQVARPDIVAAIRTLLNTRNVVATPTCMGNTDEKYLYLSVNVWPPFSENTAGLHEGSVNKSRQCTSALRTDAPPA